MKDFVGDIQAENFNVDYIDEKNKVEVRLSFLID
jgi:hypothetical protein